MFRKRGGGKREVETHREGSIGGAAINTGVRLGKQYGGIECIGGL